MRMKEEQIRNVAKVFEAFARAISKRENIKIESGIVTGKQIGRAHV